MLSSVKKQLFLTTCRYFNWKYPYPRELQPSPPKEEVIDPKNLAQVQSKLSENDTYNNEYINRNPRNLEQMLREIKPNGYPIDAPDIIFWNKLHFERSLKHTTAKVVHNSGQTIVSASTKEWAIRKHMRSTIDKSAIVNIARILAQRCLRSGILCVHKEFSNQELQTNKIKLLLQTLEEEGLKTEELSAIRPKDERYL